MVTLQLIRKIGKILRGGAGKKEILLGTLFGVLIGFSPSFSFALVVAFLIVLLLNANFSFVVLGIALGKLVSLPLAALSFHTGFFLIHNIGLEEEFRTLCNAPVTALMKLNTYAMVGSLPYALATGIIAGILFGAIITKAREKMLAADQHEVIGKALNKKITRFLLWLAFGKNKLTLEDEIPKKAPWFRKSGLILIGAVIVIGLVMELLLLDIIVRHGLESSISKVTGAEVDIGKAHLSLAKGDLELHDLQVTDPDRPTHNLIQLDELAVDVSIHDLLCNTYVINLMEGSILKHDVPRQSPGRVYVKATKEKEQAPEENLPGKSINDYFAKAQEWNKYGEKAYDYLKNRKSNAEAAAKGERPKASKEVAIANAKKLGYLRASADLVADRPAWLVHKIKVDNVQMGAGQPPQTFMASEVSSHPELNGKPTTIEITPADAIEPIAQLVLRFDNPTAKNAVTAHLTDIAIGGMLETSESFPLDVTDGKANINIDGLFDYDALDIPFTVVVHDLKANAEEGKQVMGMDSATANEVFNSLEKLEIDGTLKGSLASPRVQIDYDKLTANLKEALVAAGKKQLADRANAEMDKAKEGLKNQAGQEVNKLLGGEEGESTSDKAKNALKKIF